MYELAKVSLYNCANEIKSSEKGSADYQDMNGSDASNGGEERPAAQCDREN